MMKPRVNGIAHRETYVSAMLDIPQEILRDKARCKLGETPEKVQLGLEIMREHIKKRGLVCEEPDDFLLKFLRVKKFRYEDSCKHLEKFLNSFKKTFEKFGSVDPEGVKRVSEKCLAGCLPHRDSEGRIIMIYRMGNYGDVTWYDIMRSGVFGVFHVFHDPSTQVCGLNMIMDAQNACLQEVSHVQSHALVLIKLMEGCPFRLSRIDVINAGKIFYCAFLLIRPLLPHKLSARLEVHAGAGDAALGKYYDLSILPEEFGGFSGPLKNTYTDSELNRMIDNVTSLQRRLLNHS